MTVDYLLDVVKLMLATGCEDTEDWQPDVRRIDFYEFPLWRDGLIEKVARKNGVSFDVERPFLAGKEGPFRVILKGPKYLIDRTIKVVNRISEERDAYARTLAQHGSKDADVRLERFDVEIMEGL